MNDQNSYLTVSNFSPLKSAYQLIVSKRYPDIFSQIKIKLKSRSDIEAYYRKNKPLIDELAKKGTRVHFPFRDGSDYGVIRYAYSHDKVRQLESVASDETIWVAISGLEHLFVFV